MADVSDLTTLNCGFINTYYIIFYTLQHTEYSKFIFKSRKIIFMGLAKVNITNYLFTGLECQCLLL